MATAAAPRPWTAARFFELLGELGRVRVISVCGPSVFESLCEVGDFEVAGGHLNAITDAYHWHLGLARFRDLFELPGEFVTRSGRRVLFFELGEDAGADPFLRIYLHRAKGEEFASDRVSRFAAAHAELADGCPIATGGSR